MAITVRCNSCSTQAPLDNIHPSVAETLLLNSDWIRLGVRIWLCPTCTAKLLALLQANGVYRSVVPEVYEGL